MRRQFLFSILILVISLVLISWGRVGHSLVSQKVYLFFNQEMQIFSTWVAYITDHSSDADDRKSTDPFESPKHYIDIDNYTEFNTTGRIPQTLDSVVHIYGAFAVYDWGILPWATLTTFDSLKKSFQRRDFEKAKYFAADLSHYVADGHMPLHITANYNGQLTGNDGIHSRYESTMIGAHESEIIFTGEQISHIQNVNSYVFSYLYKNNKYVDSILIADNYAKSINSNTYSTEYKTALWLKTKGFTIQLFKGASRSLAELIYTAWKDAGSPSLTGINITNEPKLPAIDLKINYPNPFINSTHITFSINTKSDVILAVYSLKGEMIATLVSGVISAGDYEVNWNPNELNSGLYLLVLKDGATTLTKKMVKVGSL